MDLNRQKAVEILDQAVSVAVGSGVFRNPTDKALIFQALSVLNSEFKEEPDEESPNKEYTKEDVKNMEVVSEAVEVPKSKKVTKTKGK